MQATFSIGGFIVDISSNGALSSRDDEQKSGASSPGNVGLQITSVALDGKQATIMQAFARPSEARAIASALLSAATEARDEKRLTC